MDVSLKYQKKTKQKRYEEGLVIPRKQNEYSLNFKVNKINSNAKTEKVPVLKDI